MPSDARQFNAGSDEYADFTVLYGPDWAAVLAGTKDEGDPVLRSEVTTVKFTLKDDLDSPTINVALTDASGAQIAHLDATNVEVRVKLGKALPTNITKTFRNCYWELVLVMADTTVKTVARGNDINVLPPVVSRS